MHSNFGFVDPARWMIRMALAGAVWPVAVSPAPAQPVTCPGSDPVALDCNGNNTDDFCDIVAFGTSQDSDGDGVPDECDFPACLPTLWGGFESFGIGLFVHGLDPNGDGNPWINPSSSWSIANSGCPSGQGKAAKGVVLVPPVFDFMQTDLFTTDANGLLDCGAHKYSLAFDLRTEASLSPRIDWRILIRDGSNDATVALLHLASTRSIFSGVTAAQGGNGRGRILVQNPAGPPTFINTGVAIPLNSCYRIEVELDNDAPSASAVKVTIEGVLVLTTARLNPSAARMDYLRFEQVANGAAAPDNLNRLGLDNVTLCREGLALDWPDCNEDCVDDAVEIAQGLSQDCDTNGVPDECDNAENCACVESPASGAACIWCNHTHAWGFEATPPESFVVGPIDGQRGWTTFPPPNENGIPVADGSVMPCTGPPNLCGQFNNGTRMLRLGPTGFGSTGEGILGPPTRNAAGADADFEFWEFDVVMDSAPNPPNGDVYVAIWDRCNDFTGQENGIPPTALAGVPFNAGVRFNVPNGGNREIEILDGSLPPQNGLWRDQGPNRVWNIGVRKHILIKLVNSVDSAQPVPLVEYYIGTHVHGQLDTQSVWTLGVQNPMAGGDREVVLVNTSPTINAYFDNFKYDRDNNCDHDTLPDSIWLRGGARYQECYDMNSNGVPDWCEDCNNDGRLDSVEIASGFALDCNQNGIPDACDLDPTQPRYREVGIVPPGGCIPGGDPFAFASWSRRGGGSLDCNANATPDECEVPAAMLLSAVSRKACDLPLSPGTRAEPRVGGITEIRLTFDALPPCLPEDPVLLSETTCLRGGAFGAYTGSAQMTPAVVGNELRLTFAPALENARTYKLEIGQGISIISGQAVTVRALVGDVNGDGQVNAIDRSVVVGAWTGLASTCATDVTNDGSTDATDRSTVVGAWTGGQNCAP